MKKLLLVLILLLQPISFGESIQLIVDGENITHLMDPVIVEDRTMVPIKFVSDAIGANVIWHNDTRTVEVFKDDHYMKLWIDNRLVQIDDEFYISDVSPRIFNSRTFVPVRLISNGLDIRVDWEEALRHVIVDSSQIADFEAFYSDELYVVDLIKGTTDVQLNTSQTGVITKLMLINPETAKGTIVDSANGTADSLTYIPKVSETGENLLVMALYDENLNFISGAVKKVMVNLEPEIEVEASFSNAITMDQSLNFIPDYITYELTHLESNETTIISERDPYDTYKLTPSFDEAGDYRVRVIAYTPTGQYVSSEYQYGTVDVDRTLSLSISTNISGPTSMIANRNFDVDHTIFYLNDEVLQEQPWGSFTWNPEVQGEHTLKVAVISNGEIFISPPVNVMVDLSPKLTLSGVGPNEVITDDRTLKISSNFEFDEVTYYLTKSLTGQSRVLGEGSSIVYEPMDEDHGPLTMRAVATSGKETYESNIIEFEYFNGTIYGAKPVIEKDQFLDFASALAVESYKKTGMSAALQTAQAILETAWGQKLPVDKYTGEFSYNLFGIKGSASNGSVTSNTWEVYKGITYRVDAEFRAYYNVNESWDDHKRILLDLSRYAPFRDVMYDSTLGAYAIRRCGYATDPRYPRKLIDIIERYDLAPLDQLNIDLK